MQVWSLGQEDPLEEGLTIQSSILAWRIPWTEEPGRSVDHNVTQGRTQLKQLSTQNTLNCKENEDLWYLAVWQINTHLCLGNSKPHEYCWKAKSDFHQRSQNCFACSLVKDLCSLWTWVQSSVQEAHLISSFELEVHESKPQCWTHF